MTASHQFGRSDLPPEQEQALKKAVRWEYATIGYTIVTIALVALVVGNSQAMRTAWIEDMIWLVPQIAFLVPLIFVRRKPTCAIRTGCTVRWASGIWSPGLLFSPSASTSPSSPPPG